MNTTKPYSVRLPDDLRAALEQSARENDRSLHRQMLHLLRSALSAQAAPAEPQAPAAPARKPRAT